MTPAARALLREHQPEHRDGERRPGDLPFALDPVREPHADQRADRIGDRDDERVLQRAGDLDALRDQEGRNPAGEAVIADGLKQVVDHQHDGAAPIGRAPHLAPGAALGASLPASSASPSSTCGAGSGCWVSAATLLLHVAARCDRPPPARPCCGEPARRFGQAQPDPPDQHGAGRADDDHPAPAVEPQDGLRHQYPCQAAPPPAPRVNITNWL